MAAFIRITVPAPEDLIDQLIARVDDTWSTTEQLHSDQEAQLIVIDIPADLSITDNHARNFAHLPDGRDYGTGEVAIAGHAESWSWVLIDEIAGDVAYFRQITAAEAAAHGNRGADQ